MFEKEAEEYALMKLVNLEDFDSYQSAYDRFENGVQDAFQDGANFGYNKANEWHYVKDELPELYKDVLVVFPQGECNVKYLTKHNEWVGRGSWCSLTDVIAWKEIELPKEIKE